MKMREYIAIRGAVQGIGFRPFVYRLAAELRLTGWVLNSPQGVFIEAEGEEKLLDEFLLRIETDKPAMSSIQSLEHTHLDPCGYTKFEIKGSSHTGTPSTIVLPDIATCPDCLKEILDPINRRHQYPFTNCTHCGPRFSIIQSLPYDRPNTSMKIFDMCPDCRREYEDPRDRRFHAQPNACPHCGPHLELWESSGVVSASRHDALVRAAQALRDGEILALKGIGGFHLMADARNQEAVERLRRRKRREEKPFALMFPSLAAVKEECDVEQLEERLLLSPESPIVILARRSKPGSPQTEIAPSVVARNPNFGVMLPYTPLHHLLMRELRFPVIATSGNLSDEPICIDEREAVTRLHGIADRFLVHNRPIVRHVDDSVVRIMLLRELVLRRARGYAPLPVEMQKSSRGILLAVGAHLKNTIAVRKEGNVFVSQHIGDLDTRESVDAFHTVIKDFKKLYDAEPEKIVCDMHPDYLSTQFAELADSHAVRIQHHYAHVASCMAENRLEGSLLGVSWDGTGYGLDGTIWGGESLGVSPSSFERVATFRRFRLPGGEKAIREPRRSAIGLLFELYGESLFEKADLHPLKSFNSGELLLLRQVLTKGINAPLTSSVGRLFDAVASLIGIRDFARFEGQAAMELEWFVDPMPTDDVYEFSFSDLRLQPDPGNGIRKADNNERPAQIAVVDWGAMVEEILHDVRAGIPQGIISARFHNTLVSMIVAMAGRSGHDRVVLSGGCFQNKYLTERAVRELRKQGFRPYWHQRVPPNDGGISLGQVYAAERLSAAESKELNASREAVSILGV